MKPRSRAAAATLPWLRISIFITVWLSLFTYAGRPLLVAAHATGLAPALAWSVLGALALLPLLPFIARFSSMRQSNVAHWAGYVTLALFSTLLVLVFARDILNFVVAMFSAVAATAPLPRFDVALTSFAILGAALLLTAIGAAQAHCPVTRRIDVAIDDLHADLDGYRIVQWSDVHVGPTIRRRFIETLVERTNALRPDAVVITGDFIDGEFAQLRDQLEPVRDLSTRDGVFYVTGNHEYYWGATQWLAELAPLGITFLKNEHRTVSRADAQLVIAGVTDPVGRGTHRQDVGAALASAPAGATKVLLSHRPQTADEASRLGVHLQLSGHTHGGQFFPFNLVIGFFQPIVAGLHRVGQTWLYVSRGTGYWGPPSRLGVGSELTVIELKKTR